MSSPSSDAALISRQLADVHRAAQERLGLTAALLVYGIWKLINIVTPVLTPDFVVKILLIVHLLRKVSYRLAARYYNLSRAVGTGHAYPDVDSRFVTRASLEDMFSAFGDSINEVSEASSLDINHLDKLNTPVALRQRVLEPLESVPGADTAQGRKSAVERRTQVLDDALVSMFRQTLPSDADLARDVQIETPTPNWDWPEFGNEKAFDEDLLAQMESKIINDLKVISDREMAGQRAMAESLKVIQEAADIRAAQASNLVATDVVSPGRRLLFEEGDRDGRRYAWERITGPHPCAFCSMLASRGPVYRSAESAGFGNLYHESCHCNQVPIFVEDPHISERDQFFADNWATGSGGASGKQALKNWRSWLNDQYKLGLVPDQDVFGPARPA